jgi:hypothetical protein
MREIAIVLILGSIFPVRASDEVVLVVMHGRSSPIKNARYLELFDHYGLTDTLQADGQLGKWTQDTFAAYRDISSQSGNAYTLGEGGILKRFGFATLKSPAAFQLFFDDKIRQLRSQMPPDLEPKVTRSGDGWTIQTPAFTWDDGSGFSSPEWEQNARYLEPVMINSSGLNSMARLKAVPLNKMATLLEPARGKVSYLRFQPGEVPTAIKTAALRTIFREAAPGLQRRDAEGDTEYAERKAVSDAKFGFVQSLLLDIEDLTASTEWPRGDKPYKATCRLEAKKGSTLHKLLKKLGSSSSQKIAIGTGDLGNFQLATDIPPELATLANAWLRELAGIKGGIFLKPGEVRFAGKLALTNEHLEFVVGCQAEFTDPALEFLRQDRELAPVFNSVPLPPISCSAAVQQDGITLGLSTHDRVVPATDIEVIRSSSPIVARLEVDLAPLIRAKAIPEIKRLLRNLERIYTRELNPLSDFDLVRGVVEHTDKESLLKFAKHEGDWKLVGTLAIQGKVASLSLTVGSAAHRFWRLRELNLK